MVSLLPDWITILRKLVQPEWYLGFNPKGLDPLVLPLAVGVSNVFLPDRSLLVLAWSWMGRLGRRAFVEMSRESGVIMIIKIK